MAKQTHLIVSFGEVLIVRFQVAHHRELPHDLHLPRLAMGWWSLLKMDSKPMPLTCLTRPPRA